MHCVRLKQGKAWQLGVVSCVQSKSLCFFLSLEVTEHHPHLHVSGSDSLLCRWAPNCSPELTPTGAEWCLCISGPGAASCGAFMFYSGLESPSIKRFLWGFLHCVAEIQTSPPCSPVPSLCSGHRCSFVLLMEVQVGWCIYPYVCLNGIYWFSEWKEPGRRSLCPTTSHVPEPLTGEAWVSSSLAVGSDLLEEGNA